MKIAQLQTIRITHLQVLPMLGLLVLVFAPRTAFTQQKLSNDEILNEYRAIHATPSIDSIFRWDIHLITRAFLDNLLNAGVDTLVVYSVSFPGYGYLAKRDSCLNTYRTNSYFFWKKHGEYSYKDTNGRCQSQIKGTGGNVIKFAVDSYGKIGDEFFMEAISGGERNGKGIRIRESSVDHEPKYSILVVIHDRYNYLTFTENALTNTSSLFLD